MSAIKRCIVIVFLFSAFMNHDNGCGTNTHIEIGRYKVTFTLGVQMDVEIWKTSTEIPKINDIHSLFVKKSFYRNMIGNPVF